MREEYKEELKKLKDKMVKAEAFADKVPMFAEKILKEKITGEEHWKEYISYYKNLKTFDGVSRGYFKSKTARNITNLHEEHEGYFWTLHINTLIEYDSHAKYGLHEIKDKVDVFFYDRLNSTFYCTDEQLEKMLEALNQWIITAKIQAKNDRIDQDIKEAEEEVERAKNRVAALKKEIR